MPILVFFIKAIQKVTCPFKMTRFPHYNRYYVFKRSLLMKVLLIFDLNGACQRRELCSLTGKHIRDTGKIIALQSSQVFTIESQTTTTIITISAQF